MTAITLEIEQAIVAYHAQSAAIHLTATDFAEWLLELPVCQREVFTKQGFEACRTVAAFQRFCLEWRGLSMREYLVHALSYEAYCQWSATRLYRPHGYESPQARAKGN